MGWLKCSGIRISYLGGPLRICSGQAIEQVNPCNIFSLRIFSYGLVNAIIAMQSVQSYKK